MLENITLSAQKRLAEINKQKAEIEELKMRN